MFAFVALVLLLIIIYLAIKLARANQHLQNETAQLAAVNKRLQQEIDERQRVETAFRNTQQQLQTVVDNAPAVIYLKDLQSRLWLVNCEFEKIFNWSKAEVIGKCDDELFPQEVADAFKANDQVVIDTKAPLKTEEVVLQADGFLHTYLSAKFPLLDQDGCMTAIGGIATDITDRKHLEAELRRSEAQFRRLVESNVVAMGVSNLEDGSMFYANDAFLRLIGYTREELERGELNWEKITAPEYQHLDTQNLEELKRNGIGNIFEKECIRKDGRRVPILMGSTMLEEDAIMIASVIDISDRVHAEQALHTRIQQQAAVAQLGQQALNGIELDELFEQACDLVAQQFQVKYVKILELTDQETLLLRSGVGWQPGLIGQATIGTNTDSQAGYTLVCDQPVIVEDLRTEKRFNGSSVLVDHGVISGISTVISGQSQAFGVIGAHTQQKRRFSEDDAAFLQAIANIIGAAVERTAAEAAHQQSEARFRRIFESNMIGIGFWYDDGKITGANQALLKILGYKEADLPEDALDLNKITPPEYYEVDRKALEEFTVSGTCAPYEKEYIRTDGSRIPVLVGGCCLENAQDQGFFFVIDNTQRRQLEKRLRQTVHRLENLRQLDRAILELQQPEAIIQSALHSVEQLLPCQKATFITFNDAQTASIFGLGSNTNTKEISQLNIASFQPIIEQLHPDKKYALADIFIFPQSVPQIQTWQAEGLERFICFPLATQNGLLGVLQVWLNNPKAIAPEQLQIAWEVSDQVAIALQQAQLSQKVQRYNTELEQRVTERTAQLQEVNQELEAFTYTISHDLRAPLRALQGFATALSEDYSDCLDTLGLDYAQRLIAAAKNMEQLIQDLLAYSRLSRTDLRLHNINLSSVVAEAIEQLKAEIQERGAHLTVEEPLPEIHGNSTVLVQAIANLISNAIKFVPPGVQPVVRLWCEQREGSVRLWVEDNGIGIQNEHHERIFRVFERLHSNEVYPGTGIGLAIVRKAIERIGGRVEVESCIDQGSRFRIELLNKANAS